MLNFIIFLLFFVGVCFIIYSVFKFKPVDNTSSQALTEETLQKLQAAINDADNALEEINSLSQNIFDEMESKYKELLYLYSSINQKQNGMQNVTSSNSSFNQTNYINSGAKQQTVNEKDNVNFMNEFNSINPKHNEILQLSKRGMSVSEIAKKLNLGQGEVRLVLEMGKGK